MGSAVGIVAAKSNSNRFKNKNIYELNGVPLFWYSVKPMLDAKLVEEVYVATDSDYIKNYCKKHEVSVIDRTCNANHDEEPLLSALKYAYQCIAKSYNNIVTIMANCPYHTALDVDKAIELINSGCHLEVRGFNENGDESGLMVFRETVILNNFQISSHIASITTNAKEIHYLEDIVKDS